MRVRFVIIVGLCVSVLLVTLFDLLTPLNKLNAAEISVCAALGLGIAAIFDRIIRRGKPVTGTANTKQKRKKSV